MEFRVSTGYVLQISVRFQGRSRVVHLSGAQPSSLRRAQHGRPRVQRVGLCACARAEDPLNDSAISEAVRAVVRDTDYGSKNYGRCAKCDEPVVIPGLSHSLCAKCGWVKRSDPISGSKDPSSGDEVPEIETSGHHD
jgi:hypothetical protein